MKHLPSVTHEVSCKARLHKGLHRSSRRGFTGVKIRGPKTLQLLKVSGKAVMPGSLLFVIGTPRSGVNTLSQCLNMLGIKPLASDADTINQLLMQDLGVSPYSPALPPDWLNTDAASNAKSRIKNLLQSSRIFDKDSRNFSGVNFSGVKLEDKEQLIEVKKT